MAQYVFSMNRVGKIVPPKRQILKDISLSFFPGAKIGVLGTNGSGKSTLLKIMAGIDKEIEGEAIPMSGLKIGYLPQEPQLDPNETVRQSVENGMGEVKAARFEDFNLEYGSWSKQAATTKQRKVHRVPISADVATLVRQRQLVVPKGCPWLFPGDTPGQPVQEIRRFWVRIQSEADIAGVRIHDLRHTSVALAINAGAHPKAIQQRLGHASIAITMDRYGHLMAGMDAELAGDLDDLRSAK